MSRIDEQIEGILTIQKELSDGIIGEIDEMDGGDTSPYSDIEKQAIIMGSMLHFSEVQLALKAVLKAKDVFVSKNSHYSTNDSIKSLVESAYYAAVRSTNSLGKVNLSMREVAMTHAETIIDQLGLESTKKNIALIAGYIVVALNDLDSLSKRTGGVKAGGGKKKLLILLVAIAVVLLFTIGPFGGCSDSDNSSRQGNENTSSETENQEPKYEKIGDIQFQTNVYDHMFMEAKSYKDLSFANYTEDGEEDWNDDQKKDVWDSITFGDEYSSDEKVFQDILTEDIIDFVIINIGDSSSISNIDDYVTWEKENSNNFDRAEDFTLDGVHACKLYSKTEDLEKVEIVFIYKDKFYLIRPLALFEDNNQFTEEIIKGIKLNEVEEHPDAISWKDAGEHIGETVTVKGKIAEVNYSPESTGEPVFIDIGDAYPAPGRVTATIWEEDQHNFDFNPEEFALHYSVGDTVYVKGTIESYDDAYSIKVSDPSQIMK